MAIFSPDSDGFLLRCLFDHRRLTSRQLQWLSWAQTEACRDRQVIRRRMRGPLSHLGFVHVLRQESRTQEVSYALAEKGYRYIAALEGVEVEQLPVHRDTQATAPESFFYRHYGHVVDVAVQLELACRELPRELQLQRFIHEWLIAEPEAKSSSHHFVLSRSFRLGGVSHRLSPDAAAVLHFPELDGFRAAYLLEVERNTNWGNRIDKKLQQYFAQFCSMSPLEHLGPVSPSAFFVLFVVKQGPRRVKIDLMRQKLVAFSSRIEDEAVRSRFLKRFRFADLDEALVSPTRVSSSRVVLAQNILTAPIWQRWDGERSGLYRQKLASAA